MKYGKLESFYIDVVAAAGLIYKPLEIDVVIPYLESDNKEQPVAKICRAELIYAGKFVSCVQKHIFNTDSTKIVYDNRYAIYIF